MDKIYEFLKSHKYAIMWTVGYIFVMWLILRFMFNFNMFSGSYWARLGHVHLHGFPGFVFGILILAAVPLYVASMAIILRTKKPLISLPFAKKADKPAEPEQKPEPEKIVQEQFPEDLPSELREPYLRARAHVGQSVISSINKLDFAIKTQDIPQEPESNSDSDLPLPPDFDVAGVNFDEDTVPVFQDINFDEPEDTVDGVPLNDENIENTNDAVIEYLGAMGYSAKLTDDGIIVCQDMAILVHDDSRFWIADTEKWFAPGEQIDSPIVRLESFASKHKLKPVFYLAENNIMSLQDKVAEWTANGIRVISDLDELFS